MNTPTIPLWDDQAPDDLPTLTLFLPAAGSQPAPALLICPGGGYVEHAYDHAAFQMLRDFQNAGVATFFLKYRLAKPGVRHPCQLLEGQRAIRLIRSRAAEWGINPAKLGVMGFSAGGHLASMLETQFDGGDAAAADPVERQSSRPDFAILVYPIISIESGYLKNGSSANLLEPPFDLAAVQNISSQTRVTAQTPPTLLVHTEDDAIVSIQHSRLMFDALQKAGVSSEFHSYPQGKHGFGCFADDPSPPGWLDRVYAWLEGQGFTDLSYNRHADE